MEAALLHYRKCKLSTHTTLPNRVEGDEAEVQDGEIMVWQRT